MTEPGQPAEGQKSRLNAETIADLEPREDDSAALKGGLTTTISHEDRK